MQLSSEPQRPSPEALLKLAEAEARERRRGQLTIFLGYAAGVGKTYTMLETARQQKTEGHDVVAAYIESHGRTETDVLLEGVEILPRLVCTHQGVALTELDLDTTLARKPELALVDELAHTNAPGCRHEKRWQDIEELLVAGINVYTTVNVQHLESISDIVHQITGISVRETIPDHLLDQAAGIRLVDIPPEALLQRLRQGKVYVPKQADLAVQQFFRPGNLIALRELALRRTAALVDNEMRTYMETRAIAGPWPVAERLLVCASGSPYSEHLIRTTKRLADELKAQWFTVYVETPRLARELQENRQRVWRDLRLAESLGAEVATITASSVPQAIIGYAVRHNITRIVVGKPAKPRWRELLLPPIVNQIIRLSGAIHIHVVSFNQDQQRAKPAPFKLNWLGRWPDFLISAALVAATTGFSFLVRPHVSPTNLVMVYLLAVVLAAVRFGQKPAILTAFFGVLAFDFCFIAPRWSLTVADTEYLFTFVGLFTVGVVISTLVTKAKVRAEALRERELQTESLYYLSRGLAVAIDLASILEAVRKNIGESLQARLAVFIPQPEDGQIQIATVSEGLTLDAKERAVADWVFRNRRTAGHGTETLGSAALLYLPLCTTTQVYGVLGVKLAQETEYCSPHTHRLLDAFVAQISLAMERVYLARQAEQVQVLAARETLERALLNSISHDLRTPLVTIIGALSSLHGETLPLPRQKQQDLLRCAWDEAMRLNRFVGNLLDMTRLEAGELRINREPCDVQDLIGSALTILDRKLAGRDVSVRLSEELPLVSMDMVLMTQVLVNLLDNGLKYSPADSPLAIIARIDNNALLLEFLDRGPGVAEQDLQRMFEKFYRLPVPEDVSGTGLGLSICKGIVEAHGGTISAENRTGGGLRVCCRLPLHL